MNAINLCQEVNYPFPPRVCFGVLPREAHVHQVLLNLEVDFLIYWLISSAILSQEKFTRKHPLCIKSFFKEDRGLKCDTVTNPTETNC